MNNTDRAWLAGFIDGEGCFHISIGRGGVVGHPQFHLTNTNRVVMEHAARLLGRTGRLASKKPNNDKWRSRWNLAICGYKNLIELLDMVEPYLVAKRAEAAIFRQFLMTYPGSKAPRKMADAVREKRTELHRLLREARTAEHLPVARTFMKMTRGVIRMIRNKCIEMCGGRRLVELGLFTGADAEMTPNTLLVDGDRVPDEIERITLFRGKEVANDDGWVGLKCYCFYRVHGFRGPLSPDGKLDRILHVLIGPNGEIVRVSKEPLATPARVNSLPGEYQ